MITRTFSAYDLALVRRCFAEGQPDPDMLAGPDFLFDLATFNIARTCLQLAQPDRQSHFTDPAWDCLNACCLVGCDMLHGDYMLTDADYDTLYHAVSAHGFT